MTEPGPPGSSESAPEAPAPPSMTAWGRRAAKVYLGISALALAAMLVETLLGHPGTGSMFAAILAAPWSMLVAAVAPRPPMDWPLAAGLAVRMVPLALFMLLNSLIIASIAARSERDLAPRGVRAVLLLALTGALASGCALTTKQVVMVAEPTTTLYFFSGGQGILLLQFDLALTPEWNDHRGRVREVSDLSIIGDFSNPEGPFIPTAPMDVHIKAVPDLIDHPDVFAFTQTIWGPIHLEPDARVRVDWNEGMRLMGPGDVIVRDELQTSGRFTLLVWSLTPPGTTGAVAVENFRLGAVLHVR